MPRKTVLRSRSSTSFARILLTARISFWSVTYGRFSEVEPAGFEADLPAPGKAEVAARGDPSGVVDSVRFAEVGYQGPRLYMSRTYWYQPLQLYRFALQPFHK